MIGRLLDRFRRWAMGESWTGVLPATLLPPEAMARTPQMTTGYVVGDAHGNPLWIGGETSGPTMTVYDDAARARRRLTQVFRGTFAAVGVMEPLTVLRVTVRVEAVSAPVFPKLRRWMGESFDGSADGDADTETLPEASS